MNDCFEKLSRIGGTGVSPVLYVVRIAHPYMAVILSGVGARRAVPSNRIGGFSLLPSP
jgi:hypothetical protein